MKMKVKKWDIIITILLLIISFLPYMMIKGFMNHHVEGIYAYVTVNGEFYKNIPLTGQVKHKEIVVETPNGKNTLAIENESIAVIEAECSDHVCEAFGYKSMPGDIIVCMPNQLYIEIKGNKADSKQDIRGY